MGKEQASTMGIMRNSIVLGSVLLALAVTAGAADGEKKTTEQPAPKAAVKAPEKVTEKAPAKPKRVGAGGVVAKVNGSGISQQEFDRSWEYFLQRSGIPATHSEKDGKLVEFRKQVLDRLIDEELLYQEAKRLKRGASTEALEAEMTKARAQFPTPEAFKEVLAQSKITEADLRAIIGRNLSIQAYVDTDLAKGITVSDAEVHDFYMGNTDKFSSPEQARARHILVAVDEKADDKTRQAAKAKADDLLAQLKGGASFEDLAKKSSDCPSASQGGDLGFFGHGQMVPEFDSAAFALKVGELSGVVQTKFGYHIIKLEEKKDAHVVPEAEGAAKIREYLTAQKTAAAVEKAVKSLREKAKIELVMKL
jgi:peptidyl-prolyl cis-trans isomerase C